MRVLLTDTAGSSPLKWNADWCAFDKQLYDLGVLVRNARYPVNEVTACRTLKLAATEAMSTCLGIPPGISEYISDTL